MNVEIFLFWVFTVIAAVSSLFVILHKKPLISALFLILNFFSLAGIYLLLSAQFIAVSQVIVYAGAIMVLFVFVIMLLNAEDEKEFTNTLKKIKYFVYVFGAIIFVELVYFLIFSDKKSILLADTVKTKDLGTIENIGSSLYVSYVLPFVLSGFLLLIATIGAILLAKKKIEKWNE